MGDKASSDAPVSSHSHGGPTSASPAVKWLLAAIMTVFVAVTVAGAVALWPWDAPAKEPWLYEGATLVTGAVADIVVDDGEGGHMSVLLDDGRTVDVSAEPTAPLSEASVGQRVQIVEIKDEPDTFYFMDYERGLPLLLLAGLFVATVLGVARWKGLAALAGLVAALAVVWMFTLPALAVGRDPLLVALVTASMVMFVVVYLAHGISVKSTTALLGTFAGIAGVAALAWWAIPGASLTPMQDETMGQVPYIFPGLDARGILLCGMVLAGVGVLNDVTITQASAVWELREAAPTVPRRTIFAHAMRIGRDHIASIVYTIAFAYVGTALAMLLLASRLDFSILQLLTFNTIAEEVVATLVASVSLVATIPITTALGAWLAGPHPAAEPKRAAAYVSAESPAKPANVRGLIPLDGS